MNDDTLLPKNYVGNMPLPPAIPKPSKIRFKSKEPKEPQDPDNSESFPRKHSNSSRHHRHHHHHHHHRSKRRDSLPSERSLSPNSAFRESLFDAMADDEGAAFWEGVYGQPIHTYSPHMKTAEGELERMTDEAYVAYVRRKMWERSHEYIVEERKRREQQRNRKRKREAAEGKEWERGVEEALKRGEERRRTGKWKLCWTAYVKGWERLQEGGQAAPISSSSEKDDSITALRERISWPVESGSWKEVQPEQVERFFKHAPQPTTGVGVGGGGDDAATVGDQVVVPLDLAALLKVERVRWHPDKMQQRFRGQGIELDEKTLKIVTAVFQVIDRMWSEVRPPPLLS